MQTMLRIGITLGDPAGIGPELVLRLLLMYLPLEHKLVLSIRGFMKQLILVLLQLLERIWL